jgi:hypothetical protein
MKKTVSKSEINISDTVNRIMNAGELYPRLSIVRLLRNVHKDLDPEHIFDLCLRNGLICSKNSYNGVPLYQKVKIDK